MRSLRILFCLFTCLLFLHGLATSPAYTLQHERDHRKLVHFKLDRENKIDGGMKIPKGTQGHAAEAEYEASEEELIYQVDYHGVTTHPTPNPKHPKP
ncbi:hypothetical protein AMTRI_Chr12g275110 [Amborella trichopoda]|uniref:Phytosulfokine-beta n=1 Tax=Amborella trichopoda TaxID=13333 RepID=W1PHG0_AMBTC|nr:hypothetical protein AMTR_s00019p00245700 [Amborella trichopoda]